MSKFLANTCLYVVLAILFVITGSASANDVRIGVLSIRGPEDAVNFWQQVADHLNGSIPDHHFVIVPKGYKEMGQAVANGQLEFVVANPAEYIEYATRYGASRMVTQVSHVGTRETSFLGSVIFTKSTRTDITAIPDLRGKSLMAASKTAFASWIISRDELKRHGVSSDDLGSVQFAGASADKVVMAVKNGKVDVGSVRTLVLEQMAKEGKISLSDFRVINQKVVEDFPFLLSTELYPEFAFARLKHTDRQLANKVAAQLLLMPHDPPTKRYPNRIGWTVPENYETVRELLQEWRISPFEEYGKVTIKDALRQHWVTVSLALTVIIALFIVFLLHINIKQRRYKYSLLKQSKLVLEKHNLSVQEQRDNFELQAQELKAILARVKQLEGIIPICMYCKKIRDDSQSWHQLEKYISEHSEADFTHSVCPSCLEKAIAEITPSKRSDSEVGRIKRDHLI
jgi:ABC-type phosphate/phosphonate transport system substrate-binding protein